MIEMFFKFAVGILGFFVVYATCSRCIMTLRDNKTYFLFITIGGGEMEILDCVDVCYMNILADRVFPSFFFRFWTINTLIARVA